MALPSASASPVVCAVPVFSLPAKSTRVILQYEELVVISSVKRQWERLLIEFMAVAPTVRLRRPSSRSLAQST